MNASPDRKENTMTSAPNPVVKSIRLRAYPGWIVRQYRNGMFDATNGAALTLGCNSFAEAVECVRADH